MPLRIATRIAKNGDANFAYDLRERAMRGYVEATWGAWEPMQARAQIDEDISKSRLSIIEVDRVAVGMMRVDEHSSHIHVDQLFLLPQHQNQGIGRFLVESILSAAKVRGLPVRLWVLRVNPARHFYERLGFQIVEETAASLCLQSAA